MADVRPEQDADTQGARAGGRDGSPSRHLPEQVARTPRVGGDARCVRRDDEPLEEVDAEIVGEVAGLQPAVVVALESARCPGGRSPRTTHPVRPAAAIDPATRSTTSSTASGSAVPSTTTTVRPRRSGSRTRAIVSSMGGWCIARPMTASAAAALSIGSMPARGGRWAAQNMDMDPSPVGVGGVGGCRSARRYGRGVTTGGGGRRRRPPRRSRRRPPWRRRSSWRRRRGPSAATRPGTPAGPRPRTTPCRCASRG